MGNKQGRQIIKKYIEKNNVTEEELREIYSKYDSSGDGTLQRSEALGKKKQILILSFNQRYYFYFC